MVSNLNFLFYYHDKTYSLLKSCRHNNQGGRGNWGVYYTSPQSFRILFLILWLNNFGLRLLLNFDWLNVQTFQPLKVIYRRCNFVYHRLRCTLIYWPLSYPVRSLRTNRFITRSIKRAMYTLTFNYRKGDRVGLGCGVERV